MKLFFPDYNFSAQGINNSNGEPQTAYLQTNKDSILKKNCTEFACQRIKIWLTGMTLQNKLDTEEDLKHTALFISHGRIRPTANVGC